MPEALLIFTFSPVQSFITEARRTADLFSGSRILVQLAKAAANAVRSGGGDLVFPAGLTQDVPNKIVARVPWEAAHAIAAAAEAALRREWDTIADTARERLGSLVPSPDTAWQEIWQRQTANVWEVYWAAARLQETLAAGAYTAAYRQASSGLAAAKRTRAFAQVEERGAKDSLSGRREALHTRELDARAYWMRIAESPQLTGARLQPQGRERLDAVGAVKRFGRAAQTPFLSTSSIAGADFLAGAREKAPNALAAYRGALATLFAGNLYEVRHDPLWPYDGNLLYLETLTENRLTAGYPAARVDSERLKPVRQQLASLHHEAGAVPSPYYAVVVLDGDDMGKQVNNCLRAAGPEASHRALSASLSRFGEQVGELAAAHRAELVYNGGDDVLLLAPLAQAIPVAQALAAAFALQTGGTASAGVAIAHHLSPLDAALRAARDAERRAKSVPEKAAVAVQVLKRSGETVDLLSPWRALDSHLHDLIVLLQSDAEGEPLSAGFVADLSASARAFAEPDQAFASEIRRLLSRHRKERPPRPFDPATVAESLTTLALALPRGARTEMLARWAGFARFVARGGEE